MTTGPSPELSRRVSQAIQQALIEEKAPRWTRLLKGVASSTVCTVILALPLFFQVREQLGFAWKMAALAWWLCLSAGFSLYYYPQPRLAVPGYWCPWIFAKILIAMVVLTGLEILLCPSFVYLDASFSLRPLASLTGVFMSIGGMGFCMFCCGFLFASVGGLVSFLLIARTLKGSSWWGVLTAGAVAFSTQLPLVGVQLADAALRPTVCHWALGGLVGITVMAGMVRVAALGMLARS